MLFFLSIILGLSFLFPNMALASELPDLEELKSRIEAHVEQAIQTGPFHGNIEVRIGHQTLYKKSTGLAIEAFQVEHQSNSRFMMASLSKSFTAAAILKLVDQGRIQLDQPYCRYVKIPRRALEANKKNWCQFTIRDLLTHTAGIIRDPVQVEFYAPNQYQPFIRGILSSLVTNINIFLQSETHESRYSNLGYMMLAYLVETITKNEFHMALRESVLIPLQLQSTGQFHRMFAIPFLAEGYEFPDGKEDLHRRCCSDASSYAGSHSLYSDVDDLMTWLEALFSHDSDFLSPEMKKEMTSKQAPLVQSDSLHYGFGLYVDETGGTTRYWHDGFEPGYLSLISYIPKFDARIVILSNRHTSEVYYGSVYTNRLHDQISERLAEYL